MQQQQQQLYQQQQRQQLYQQQQHQQQPLSTDQAPQKAVPGSTSAALDATAVAAATYTEWGRQAGAQAGGVPAMQSVQSAGLISTYEDWLGDPSPEASVDATSAAPTAAAAPAPV
jgi:hypothetical protein